LGARVVCCVRHLLFSLALGNADLSGDILAVILAARNGENGAPLTGCF
jgi:hypothetical protein